MRTMVNLDNHLPLPLHHPMGSSASKAARKLPKRVDPPKWAGKRTPGPSTGTTGEQVDETLASEHRSKGALDDFFRSLFLTKILVCVRLLSD